MIERFHENPRRYFCAASHVLDGGMAFGARIPGRQHRNGPLWSKHTFSKIHPEKIVAVHRAYIEAGSEIIETAQLSQVSRMGYAEVGLDPCRR